MADVSALGWNTAAATLNALITALNAVAVVSTTGTVTPAVTLEGTTAPISRTVNGPPTPDDISAQHFSDADGMAIKYNALRKYDSARRIDNAGAWYYGLTVISEGLAGHRDTYFSVTTPAYITPPVAGDIIQYIPTGNTDMFSIINAGVAIHNTTILGVASGSEYVVINECHSYCHGNCHSSCHRNRR
jgi:hypothetical protein